MQKNKRLYIRDGRAPIPKSVVTSRVMSANKAKNTGPELALQRVLRERRIKGCRFHWKKIIGRPDIAFPTKHVAVFIHGCFWHRCPYCKMPMPKSHKVFWRQKFERNKKRDIEKVRQLISLNWRVLTIWECEIKKDPDRVIERIHKLLKRN